jgi:signal transduction histidine kinase
MSGTPTLNLEDSRLDSLFRYNILDTPPEAGFDDIVRVAASVCDTPVSLVSFVSFDRQWFKARKGFPACETSLDSSVCAHVVRERELLVIPDLRHDARTCENPLVTGPPNIRFYAGAPLVTPEKHVLGALCVIDDKPRPVGLDAGQKDAINVLASQVMLQLELRRITEAKDRDLMAAIGATELREQFIAVLGHDLRNPLAAIGSGIQMLQTGPSKAVEDRVLRMMQQSVTRMAGLIDNVLDFARGSLGGAFDVAREPVLVQPVLEQVVAELQSAWPGRTIDCNFAISRPVRRDTSRIAQLFSNLLGNALVHGLATGPVTVKAATRGDDFELEVANPSPEISRQTLERLFHPFVRNTASPDRRGLGLGLYIASQIAQAHHGDLSAEWRDGQTRFRFSMPAA